MNSSVKDAIDCGLEKRKLRTSAIEIASGAANFNMVDLPIVSRTFKFAKWEDLEPHAKALIKNWPTADNEIDEINKE